MAQSQLNLYNLAVAAIGGDYTLAATNEETLAAEACEMWFENTRQVLLRSAWWGCSKKFARLVEKVARDTAEDWVETDPEPGYAYSYELPDDYLYARFLTDYAEFDISNDDTGRTLVCNVGGSELTDAPVLCYSADIEDPANWEADLYQSMVYALGSHINLPLTGKTSKTQLLVAMANSFVQDARVNTANERHRLMRVRPEVLALRGTDFPIGTPFFFPYGSMLTSTGAPVT